MSLGSKTEAHVRAALESLEITISNSLEGIKYICQAVSLFKWYTRTVIININITKKLN
jgi:hypothetical protein